MGEGKLENRLWEIFNLGMEAGYHSGMRLVVDNARDNAAKIIKKLTTMRSPEEVRKELEMTDRFLRQIGYTQDEAKHWVGYGCALKWMLREEE